MQDALTRRWRMEKAASLAGPVGFTLALVAILLTVVLLVTRPTSWLLAATGTVIAIAWVAGVIILLVKFLQKPSTAALAKRADHIFALKDDLLALSELENENAAQWKDPTLQQAEGKLAARQLAKSWPVRLSRTALIGTLAAVFFSALLGWVTWQKNQFLLAQAAAEKAAQAERLAAAEEILKDWKEFSELSEDEELKKLFAETENLQQALENPDPMAAMLEMNRIEEKMSALEQSISQDSLAPQAATMAEALEAFEGMGAMSAALRNKNFEAAAAEAEKLATKLEKDKQGQTALRREQAVAEMLAAASQNAGNRGNNALSEALSQMSSSAQKSNGSVPNDQLCKPTQTLCDQFSQENARQNRGRAASLGKKQMENLRRKLRNESNPSSCPSLCQSCLGDKPGGSKAGTGTAGDPKGEKTALVDPGLSENVAVQVGEGESEVVTMSSSSGSGGAVAGAKPTTFSDYKELSDKAVADENLPLAHRRVIRAYFERIRPVAESHSP